MKDQKSKSKNNTQSKAIFPSAEEDAKHARQKAIKDNANLLAYCDDQFLLRDELRAVRLQLEWLKPDTILAENNIDSTVIIFGSARFPHPQEAAERYERAEKNLSTDPHNPQFAEELKRAKAVVKNSQYYVLAREMAKKITQASMAAGGNEYVVVTGGGPGIMEAANRGASEAGGRSIGLNIVLPTEQQPNEFITPKLSFQFHYFAIRKMHFLKRAKGMIAFPGGVGTLDELFESLTLVQTRKIDRLPIILFGKEYWQRLIDFEFLVEQGAINRSDLESFRFVDTVEEAWLTLTRHWP